MELIAITGMACRFPGAPTLEDFWSLLSESREGIVEVPEDRWNIDAYFDADPKAAGKTNARTGGFIEGVDRFDAAFFGIAPREAAQIDPQQRILLELAYEALEDAGIAPARLAGSDTAVFVGAMTNDYFRLQLSDGYRRIDSHTGSGGGLGMLANRLSYQFDLRGPSITVDTACSSSLVAVMQACQALWTGQSRLALAAGVNVMLDPSINVFYTKAGLSAADGRCKTFAATADGIGRAEGAGVIVLKPFKDAQADGDPIYAVIRGGAVNHDGRSNGMTQPNRWAQEQLLRDAFAHAGIDGSDPQYIELHGTGTLIGDPIEANALASVLEQRGERTHCLVGSVKTNFGHLEAAAGIAGLIKLALSVSRGAIPPSLWFDAPNPHIPFDSIPLRVNTRLSPWEAIDGRRVGGVSSFGLGGANAHVVVESVAADAAVSSPVDAGEGRAHALLISARSADALTATAERYLARLKTHPQLALSSLCATALARKGVHERRAIAIGRDVPSIETALKAIVAEQPHPDVVSGRFRASRRGIVAVLPVPARIEAVALAAVASTAIASDAWARCRDRLAARGAVLPACDPLVSMVPIEPQTANFAYWQFALQYALLAPMTRDLIASGGAIVAEGTGQLAALAAIGAIALDDALAWLDGHPPTHSVLHYALPCAFASGSNPGIANIDPSARGDWRARVAALEGIDEADIVVLGDDATGIDIGLRDGQERTLHPLAMHDGWSRMFASLALRHTLTWAHWAEAGKFVRLPSYPWQREAYWLPGVSSRASAPVAAQPRQERVVVDAAVHALGLLGARIDLPTVAWRRELGSETVPYLPDHQVQGAMVLPGAGYVEIGLAVHAAIDPQRPAVLRDLSFRQALMVDDGQTVTMHVAYDKRQREFAVHSRKRGADEWTLHALGRLGDADAVEPVDLPGLKARCPRFTDGDVHYANMRQRGFGYGPAFQGVSELWLEDSGECVLARIVRPVSIAGDNQHEHLHPALFDASLQSILTTLTARGDNDLYIPTGIDRLVLHRPTGDAFWCYGGLKAAGHGQIKGEVLLFDDEGRVIAEARGVRAQALTRSERDDSREIDQWLYAWRWQPAPIADTATGGCWLLLDDGPSCADIARRLRDAGATRVVVARQGDVWEHDGDDYVVPRDGLEGLDRVIRDIGPSELTGAIYGRYASDAESMPDASPDGGDAAAPLLHVLRAMDSVERATKPRCLVLTRKAQAVPEGGDADDQDVSGSKMTGLNQSPLLGLARVAVNEFASLHVRAVDLDDDPQAIDDVVREILSTDDEEEVAWRAGRRYAHRMVRTTAAEAKRAAPPAAETAFSASASYLITGGFGGFGLEAADWMVAQGVRHLALVGRRGAGSADVRERLDMLRARGATILEVAADIASETQVIGLLERIRAELPPLEGVFHAAAALDDAPIAQLTSAQIDHAMAAKCRGAWYLHRHTANDPLKHFVLFSSISAMVGGTGQTSYAMACAYLDALARYRRSRGRTATSINWGALRDVGMATRFGDIDRLLGGTGLGMFSPAQAVRLLEMAVGWQPVELGIAKMDWSRWTQAYPTWGASPKYRHLLAATMASGDGDAKFDKPIRTRLLAATPDARLIEIADLLAEFLAETIKTQADAIDRTLPLPGLGLDSMMALDLLAAMEDAFGVKVPMLLVMKGNSVEQLAPQIAALIVESAQGVASPDPTHASTGELPEQLDPESVERFIAGLGDLDDDEVERLLKTITYEEDATT
jgi:acyl transferase domain-containing protein/acyl carrier protein